MRADAPVDLRPVLRIVSDEIARTVAEGRLVIDTPDAPVMSDLDPDALAILARNLIDNALRHGNPDAPVAVRLAPDGRLSVANDGPAISPDQLACLTQRFVRGGATEGSGLGLAIVAAIARRVDAPLELRSPRPGSERGLVATVRLPIAGW